MKELAQAISALINSSPRTPWVEEIEAVIRQHMPEAPSDAVTRIDPAALIGGGLLVWPKSQRVRLNGTAIVEYATEKAVVLYCRQLLLVDPRDDARDVRGLLLKPPRIYVVWYDDEMDFVDSHLATWRALSVLVPQTYERLMKAWQMVKDANP